MKQSKKGISPLIATVLLIAFSVALGVIIMNWSLSKIEAGHANPCEAFLLELERPEPPISLCYEIESRHLKYQLRNAGDETIDRIRLIVSEPTTSQTIDLNVSLDPFGPPLTESRQFVPNNPKALTATFVVLTEDKGAVTSCPQAGLDRLPILEC